MKKSIFLSLIVLLINGIAVIAQNKRLFSETDAQKQQRLAWWTDDRFGMFIHFGLCSLPARHEWVKSHEHLTDAQYRFYFDQFDPVMAGQGKDIIGFGYPCWFKRRLNRARAGQGYRR